MKSKIIAILTSILIIFIILIVVIFCVKIKINNPCKLFITDKETFLVIENNDIYNEIKSYQYFDLIDQKTKESTRFYVKNNFVQSIENLIFLQNNKDCAYNVGWHEVLLFIRSESIAEHYLGF
ncbi:hypothetical protein [Mycoplasmoides alvi]|uniref:hypothetical protein n=1 Tax=Mycoplasmoides alvi TaxID=78580 RepID=UPI00051BB619|nr:hypothetical protein [Mycoplasmoides alvi]